MSARSRLGLVDRVVDLELTHTAQRVGEIVLADRLEQFVGLYGGSMQPILPPHAMLKTVP